ncbi:MAG: hypothetical protein JWM53_4210 [bacterium]|nr:hypothetical protein [bacterium]
MRNRFFLASVCLLVGLAARSARADGVAANLNLPYSASVFNAGPGFRLGNAPLVLHLGLASDIGYDSNVLYDHNAVAGAVTRLRAHLDLATVSYQPAEGEVETAPPTIAFRLSSQFEYREYLTDRSGQLQSSRNFNFFADTGLTLFPRRRFTLQLANSFARTSDPVNVENTHDIVRDLDRFNVVASIRPGGGAIDFGFGDAVHVSYMGENASYAFSSFYGDEASTYVRWLARPNTTVSLQTRAGYFHYPNHSVQNSSPLRVAAAATWEPLHWLVLTGTVGYGNSFNRQGASYNNALGSAFAQLRLPHDALLSARYEREFYPSVLANFYRDDAFALAYRQPLVTHVAATVAGAVYLRTFEGLIEPALLNAVAYSSPTHSGPIYEARAELNVQALKWLSVGASYVAQVDTTNFVFYYANYAVPDSYIKHSVFGRIDVAY